MKVSLKTIEEGPYLIWVEFELEPVVDVIKLFGGNLYFPKIKK